MAPQFNATKGFAARGDALWIASAASSLPVPLSPVMKTLAREAATLSIVRYTACIGAEAPMKPKNRSRESWARTVFSSWVSARFSSALVSVTVSRALA